MIYKISKFYDDFKGEQFPTFHSEFHMKQHLSSRSALKKCLIELKNNSSESFPFILPLKLEALEITNFLFMKNAPDILVSISHTSCIGAAVVSNKQNHISIGIDIELKSRQLNPDIMPKFINSQDDEKCHTEPIISWCKKESAFKALYPVHKRFKINKTLVLNDIWIQQNSFGLVGNQKKIGTSQSFIETIDGTEIIVALSKISE